VAWTESHSSHPTDTVEALNITQSTQSSISLALSYSTTQLTMQWLLPSLMSTPFLLHHSTHNAMADAQSDVSAQLIMQWLMPSLMSAPSTHNAMADAQSDVSTLNS